MNMISEGLILTVIKHNFSSLGTYDNPFIDMYVIINQATGSMVTYAILVLIFAVSFYVFIRKTQDMAKSLISSTHLLMLTSILLFFAGKTIGVDFVSEVFMLGVLVFEAMAIGGTFYLRSNKT